MIRNETFPLTVEPLDARWKARFWAIFTGQALSLGGSSLTQFVLMWWIADTTGSVAALSMAGPGTPSA